MATKEKMLEPDEFGLRVGLSQRQVYHRLKAGQINGRKYGWVWMVPESEIERIKDLDWYKASKKADPVPA